MQHVWQMLLPKWHKWNSYWLFHLPTHQPTTLVTDGFWSIHLDTPPYLTTFNTHKGCYQHLHMPFGLKMSQDVFQMHMDQITNRLPGIIVIHNNICVYGKTREEHDTNLLKLMKTASKDGLVFKSQMQH